MNIFITGASGLLGAHLMAAMAKKDNVLGIDRHSWWGDQPLPFISGELRETRLVANVMDMFKPEILIHCAAFVDVDGCERDPAKAYAFNTELTRTLVQLMPANCLFIYISTDSIFGGDNAFTTEECCPRPRSIYARSKLFGENEVAKATANHLIIRTNFYGWSSGRKQTLAEWIYESLSNQTTITLFDDIFFTPIYVVDFTERLKLLIEGEHRGIFHLCGQERVSKYQFGMLMAEVAGLPIDNVRQGSVETASLSAPRPKDMSLSSDRFRRLTGIEVPWCMGGLRRFVADRGRPLSVRTS